MREMRFTPLNGKPKAKKKEGHAERDHSKYSASGSERWHECPGSVELSEGLPDKSSEYAKEGTQAHEVLETIMLAAIQSGVTKITHVSLAKSVPNVMKRHGLNAANFILSIWEKHPHSEVMVETRVYLDWIDPEMFGTFDGAVVELFGVLHVFDYKYGKKTVSPIKNLQMIFYAIGLAKKYDWNFEFVRVWIIQPRAAGYRAPVFWDIPILQLKEFWQSKFVEAVKRVRENPNEYKEGPWCHWCKAKGKCPLKVEGRNEKARSVFAANPINRGGSNEIDEIEF